MDESCDFFELPGRLFLDSCTLQSIGDYGEFLFENVPLEPSARILRMRDGYENLCALRNILFVCQRGNFEFKVGMSSRQEVAARANPRYMTWFEDVFSYSEVFSQISSGITIGTEKRSQRLDEPMFGYLSTKDRSILKDAVALDCDALLTMERKLPRNGPHLTRHLGIRVLTPSTFWNMLRPWARIFV